MGSRIRSNHRDAGDLNLRDFATGVHEFTETLLDVGDQDAPQASSPSRHFQGERLEKTFDRGFIHVECQGNPQSRRPHGDRRRTNGPHIVPVDSEPRRKIGRGSVLSDHNRKDVRAGRSETTVAQECVSRTLDEPLQLFSPRIAARAQRHRRTRDGGN